jgi:hypothetical protein
MNNDKIISTLKSSPGKDVVLTLPADNMPMLKGFELSPDKNYLSNRYMADYFGNSSIVATTPEKP